MKNRAFSFLTVSGDFSLYLKNMLIILLIMHAIIIIIIIWDYLISFQKTRVLSGQIWRREVLEDGGLAAPLQKRLRGDGLQVLGLSQVAYLCSFSSFSSLLSVYFFPSFTPPYLVDFCTPTRAPPPGF